MKTKFSRFEKLTVRRLESIQSLNFVVYGLTWLSSRRRLKIYMLEHSFSLLLWKRLLMKRFPRYGKLIYKKIWLMLMVIEEGRGKKERKLRGRRLMM